MKTVITTPGGYHEFLTTCRGWLTKRKFEHISYETCLGKQQNGHQSVLCPTCDTYLKFIRGRWYVNPRPQ